MSDEITQWIRKLSDGDEQAPNVIWKEYFEKLVRLAHRRLGAMPRRAVDEEDIALSAMNSLFRGVEAQRFPALEDRDDLWKILVTITARKAVKHQRRHYAEKRGGGRTVGESVFLNADSSLNGFDNFLGSAPTDELADEVSSTCTEMIKVLDDEKLEKIAHWKLEGFTNDEIAEKLDVTIRTVERKLARIRDKWRELDPDLVLDDE